MEYKDYYKIIGVEKTAAQDEIKRAYRKLARKYHPDVSKVADAEGKFKEVGEAYEVLKDPEKRAAYDQLGANWQAGQNFNPPPGWDEGFEFSGGGANAGFNTADSADFSDFFESLFGQQQQYGSQQQAGFGGAHFQARGEDHHAKVLIDLEDSFHGSAHNITLHAPDVNNQGRVITRERTLSVRIPKGVKQGQQIRLSGQGSPGVGGGGAGDLYLEVEFKPHRLYRAEGHDIYLELPLAPWEAALGATIKAPTPTGTIDLKIPAGSSSGRQLRLKGRGIPAKMPGDLYAVLRIALPPAETEQEKELYRKMAKEMSFDPRAGIKI